MSKYDDRETWFDDLRRGVEGRPVSDQGQEDILVHLGIAGAAEICFRMGMPSDVARLLFQRGYAGPRETPDEIVEAIDLAAEGGDLFKEYRDEAAYNVLQEHNVRLDAVGRLYSSPHDVGDLVAEGVSSLFEQDVRDLCLRPWCTARKTWCPDETGECARESKAADEPGPVSRPSLYRGDDGLAVAVPTDADPQWEPIRTVDELLDVEHGIHQLHCFQTEGEADAFCAGIDLFDRLDIVCLGCPGQQGLQDVPDAHWVLVIWTDDDPDDADTLEAFVEVIDHR
ncbi:hypothetical protein C882_0644 [Caenispirillum salinarum AK4]|uniref:Uncharacterized protein n=1 Tax=Caenispirillum salinarum AK4 TaxID=1238182 RepID=K9HJV3_9PROT|nr:hypothetical protein [Caenispirillum salinarum]EKV28881.1 hypothetical protein C882_0644 [Caenispirillum salinarum AK4]